MIFGPSKRELERRIKYLEDSAISTFQRHAALERSVNDRIEMLAAHLGVSFEQVMPYTRLTVKEPRK
jgi:hypothetical protein